MIDPVTIGLAAKAGTALVKLGALIGATYLVIRVLTFQWIRDKVTSWWSQYVSHSNLAAFWMTKKKIEEKQYAERDLHVFGILDRMTGQILDWEAVMPETVDQEFAEFVGDEEIMYFTPEGV